MAQRTVCLCEGKYIGIETIFTIVEGKQINIPDKLEALREKSRKNLLFCPCGCGANLILVASDRNLREQHFRIKDASMEEKCQASIEGKTSIDSKIVLKYWMVDALGIPDVDSRVPICDISDSDRKYELTHLSKDKKVAINYCRDRGNLEDEKFDVIEANKGEYSVIHILDISNEEVVGQYPEGVMKVQNRQGYCLFLKIEEREYQKAVMKAMYFYKDYNGLWNSKLLVQAMLFDYRIGDDGELYLHGIKLSERAVEVAQRCREQVEADRKRMEEERLRREEEHRLFLAEQERMCEEQRKREAEAERQRVAREEARRKEEEKKRAEKERADKEFQERLPQLVSQQEEPAVEPDGHRWYCCKVCGVIGQEKEFLSYGGGPGQMNLGLCKECGRGNKQLVAMPEKERMPERDRTKCPVCGMKLVERRRRDGGKFIGCTGYPLCNYTHSI